MEQNKILCPITGQELIYVGHDEGVMDGNSYFSPEEDSSIIFAVHPFRSNIYAQVDHKSFHSKELKYFKLLDTNQWQEMKKVPFDNLLFPIEDEGEEWKKACSRATEKNEERIEKLKYWEEHPEEDPRIHSKLINSEIVKIMPMSPPAGILFYLDMKYDGKNTD
jgi:hypothetical protein